MNKMYITLLLEEDKWKFLEPMLSSYVVPQEKEGENKKALDFEAIKRLKLGASIVNILNDGCWDRSFTFTGDGEYCVRTIEELKRVTEREFRKHRRAGKLTWAVLQEYVKTLK